MNGAGEAGAEGGMPPGMAGMGGMGGFPGMGGMPGMPGMSGMPDMSQMEELLSKMSPEERSKLEAMAKEQMGNGMGGMNMGSVPGMEAFDPSAHSSGNVDKDDGPTIQELD
jgi:hypothetical protein